MVKRQINLSGKPISQEDSEKSIKRVRNSVKKIEKRNPKSKEFSEGELKVFPKNLRNLNSKIKDIKIERTLEGDLNYFEKLYEQSPESALKTLNYGISLLENGDLVKAGEILNKVEGSEGWDSEWPYALLHKARIAAVMGEFEYTMEYLRRVIRAAVALGEVWDSWIKEKIEELPEFQKYRKLVDYKLIMRHNFDTEEEKKKFWSKY